MARRRYRRYKRHSGRWAANIQEIDGTVTASPGSFSQSDTLLLNPPQTPNIVTQVFTIKNIEITFVLDFKSTDGSNIQYIEGVTAYIMYVPQGMNLTSNYNVEHPEYIMAYKFLGSPLWDKTSQGQQFQPFKIRTRLARKLQSGDNIILFIKGINQAPQTTFPLRLSGLVRWWTKAN